MRGALFLRGEGTSQESFTSNNPTIHVLDWACISQRLVTRSTFAAEPFAAGDALGQGMLVAQILHETEKGELSAGEARRLREQEGLLPMALYVDAMSVFAATTATFIKTPAENPLVSHPVPS